MSSHLYAVALAAANHSTPPIDPFSGNVYYLGHGGNISNKIVHLILMGSTRLLYFFHVKSIQLLLFQGKSGSQFGRGQAI